MMQGKGRGQLLGFRGGPEQGYELDSPDDDTENIARGRSRTPDGDTENIARGRSRTRRRLPSGRIITRAMPVREPNVGSPKASSSACGQALDMSSVTSSLEIEHDQIVSHAIDNLPPHAETLVIDWSSGPPAQFRAESFTSFGYKWLSLGPSPVKGKSSKGTMQNTIRHKVAQFAEDLTQFIQVTTSIECVL